MNGQVRVQLSEEGLAPQGQPLYLVILGLTILVMTLLRVIVPMIETPRPGFLLFVLYAVLHLTVLLPPQDLEPAHHGAGRLGLT